MDINQANMIIKISPEEIKSFEKYISYDHALINMICNMDINYYREVKEKNIIPKDKEEFKSLLNDFVNMYSIITKIGTQAPRRLHRGSANNNLQITPKNSFISTSLSRNIAQSFMKNGEGVISTYSVPSEIPVLNVEHFKESFIQGYNSRDELGSRDEQEYIIYPFTEGIETFIGKNDDGCSIYNVTLKKQELEKVDEDELKRLSDEVIDGFEEFIESLNEEEELDNKARLYYHQFVTNSSDDMQYVKESYERYSNEKKKISRHNDQYRNSVVKLIRGLCKAKELEINDAYKVIQDNSDKKYRENDEKNRKEVNSALYQTYGKISEDFKYISGFLMQNRENLMNTAKKEKRMSSALGIEDDDGINRMQINSMFEQIIQKIRKITDELAIQNNGENIPLADATGKMQSLNEYEQVLNDVKGVLNDLTNCSRQYSAESQNVIKENLYNKVFNVLKSSKQSYYYGQLKSLQSKKPNLLDRITGKAKLRDEQIRQLNLKIQYENFTTPEKKQRYSVHDMLTEIYYTSEVELNGNVPPIMQDLISRINSQYQESYVMPNGQRATRPFSKDKLLSNIISQERNTRDNALVIPRGFFRGLFASRRAAIALQTQNNALEQGINKMRQYAYDNRYANGNKELYNDVKSQSLVRYHEVLNYISRRLDTIDPKNERTKEGELNKNGGTVK